MQAVMYKKGHVKVADELFLVVALLHRENPDRTSFEIREILERAKREGLGDDRSDQKSLKQHAYQHAAANMPPDVRGGKYRMVFREPDNTVRLLCPTDYVHPDRYQKLYPSAEEVPRKYHELLDWAKSRCQGMAAEKAARWLAGLHQLKGLGKDIWKGIDVDEYVRGLREGWE